VTRDWMGRAASRLKSARPSARSMHRADLRSDRWNRCDPELASSATQDARQNLQARYARALRLSAMLRAFITSSGARHGVAADSTPIPETQYLISR